MPKRKRDDESSEGDKTFTAVRNEKTGEIIPGVRLITKSGRYCSRAWDVMMRKQVGLGTFDTAQQAFEAYQAKKAKNKGIMEEVAEKRIKTNEFVAKAVEKKTGEVNSHKVVDEKTGEVIPGIQTTKSGKFRCRAWDPTINKQVTVGTFDTAQQASEACKAKKAQIQALLDEKNSEKFQEKQVWVGTFDIVKEPCKAYRAKRARTNAVFAKRGQVSEPADTISIGEDGIGSKVQPEKSSCLPDSVLRVLEEFGDSGGEKEEGFTSPCAMEVDEVVRTMQEGAVSVSDEKYQGGAALGFLIPSNFGRDDVFLPVIDNYGSLLGRFREIDDLSLSDW